MSTADPQVEAIESRVELVRTKCASWARHWAAKYNGAVYLTGSVLHNPTPRDIDIRIVVADHEFAARYGMEMKPTTKEGWTNCIAWDEEGPTQHWVDDLAKITAVLSVQLKENVDLQVWPLSHWRGDIYPKPIQLAAPSPGWFVYTVHCPDPSDTSLSVQARALSGETT